MASEQQRTSRAVALRTQQEVFAIARKTLVDLAATSLEERMAAVFIRRLHELDSGEKQRLAAMLKSVARPAIVRSAFELPDAQREAIDRAVRETLAVQTSVQFETAPQLVSGIELTTDGHKVSWSIADYLMSLEKSVSEILNGIPVSAPLPAATLEMNNAAAPSPEAESNDHAA
jgi:F-type H+-transporting ATPase subunit b